MMNVRVSLPVSLQHNLARMCIALVDSRQENNVADMGINDMRVSVIDKSVLTSRVMYSFVSPP